MPDGWTQRDVLNQFSEVKDKDILISSQRKPVSWKSDDDNFFFTICGGTVDSYQNKNFIGHVMGGIKYALQGSALDYSKATSPRVPEENRFLPLVLDSYLDEPIEMEIISGEKVLFIERHGKIKLYDPVKKSSKVIAELAVQLEGNYEDGLLGLELDPAFDKNHFIYLYYSPLGGKPVQNLSRFTMLGDSVMMNTEKVVLEVAVQRETCCHSAGNVYFGPDGYLYLSTGDNTSSKESDGFTPIDERENRSPFDAQKSSANSHDLRGKILRIKLNDDGTYTIPDGNLFPKDGKKGRPEIYVMGARNPYRITVDKRGFLYWGDVGPDGGETTVRGPKSHDEWNQARTAGYFGWPYFVGDNKAYSDFDFTTNAIGSKFDSEHPVNESPNNFGSKILPPAQSAMIWYPYGESTEFPMLGTGSRSAMSGPFYYYDDVQNSTVKLPAYYNNKLLIFEWARDWIKAVSFDAAGTMTKIEPLLNSVEFFHPIDVKFGKDGALYVLQYGSNYFARNPNAQLVRIEYAEGNRQPVAEITADKIVGKAPLTVKLSAIKSFDYDKNSKLSCAWQSANGSTSVGEETVFTYTTPGIYKPSLTVTDQAGGSSTVEIEIKVGNDMPQVSVAIKGNTTFYFDNYTFDYEANVIDTEDGVLNNGITLENVKFSIDYLKEGKDMALLASLGSSGIAVKHLKGKSLIDASDCKSCHSVDKKSIGPSYTDVAKRYKNNGKAKTDLVQKVIKGGNGNWGDPLMAAHPQLSEHDTRLMVEYILSLAEVRANLPLKGSYQTKEHIGKKEAGLYLISCSYTDKGEKITGPLTGKQLLMLRNSKVQAEDFDSFFSVGQQRPINGEGDITYVSDIKHDSYIAFKNIDLNGIVAIDFNVQANSGRIEIHAGSKEGELLGTANLQGTATGWPFSWRIIKTPIKKSSVQTDIFFVFKNDESKGKNFMGLDWIQFKVK